MERFVRRQRYLDQIGPFINKDLVKVLTGIRRSGKSTLLRMIREEFLSHVPDEQIFEMDLESRRGLDITNARLLLDAIDRSGLDRSQKIYFFFDEIQLVEGWERAINSLRVDWDCDIYITGSNASLLSGELATLIAGRYVCFEVLPFSFLEYRSAVESFASASIDREELFKNYLTLGGMPFLKNTLGLPGESLQYLRDLFDSIVIKDITNRHALRNIDLLRRLLFYIFEQCGQTFSARSIQRYLKSVGVNTSVDTILQYLRFYEEAFIIHKVDRFNIKGKYIFSSQEKYYLTDHGFREALGYSNQAHIGAVLENIVYNELKSRRYRVAVGDLDGKEIDFVAQKDERQIYVQVTYMLLDEKTVEREFAPLLTIPDNFAKYVLSLDPFDRSREGVVHMNIIDFLLGREL